MNDPHAIQPGTTAHGAHHPADHATPAEFSEGEMKEFQKSDRGAGAVIILLMTGIFLVGVALYTTIAVITY